MQYIVKVVKQERNDHGHRSFHCHIIERSDDGSQEFHGPVQIFGIDKEGIKNLHKGDYHAFLLSKKQQMIDHHKDLRAQDEAAEKLHGTEL